MYQLKKVQVIPTDLQTCWDFFSAPANLKKITPPYMGFDMQTEVPGKMYEGMMIAYRVTPLWGIPVQWITEIKYVHDLEFFVDEQRQGPYRIWHHEHHFREVPGGVEMTDIVSYTLPAGVFGKWAHPFLVRRKLNEIFDYRFQQVEALFGKP